MTGGIADSALAEIRARAERAMDYWKTDPDKERLGRDVLLLVGRVEALEAAVPVVTDGRFTADEAVEFTAAWREEGLL